MKRQRNPPRWELEAGNRKRPEFQLCRECGRDGRASALATDRTPRKREETRMKLMKNLCLRAGGWMEHCLTVLGLMAMVLASMAHGQAVSTTTVQGTVYLANGQ